MLSRLLYWFAGLLLLSACSAQIENDVGRRGDRQNAPVPLWTAKVAGDVLSKAFFPMEGVYLDDYELRHAEEAIDVYGMNEWWVMTSSSSDVFVPRSMVKDITGPDQSSDPPPIFNTFSRSDHAPCPIQTVDEQGMFRVIGSLPPNHPVGVYALGATYAQISPWLHWVSSSCLVNAPADRPGAIEKEIAGFMRSFRNVDGSWNGSVICYASGQKVYLGYRDPGAPSATVPYGGPKDGTECAWAEQPFRWEGPKPGRRLCATFGGCTPATQSEVPFNNLAEMVVLQSLLSISGQPIQNVEFGPTGGGRFIVGFLGATGEQINAAAQSQAVDMVFAFTAYAAAFHAPPSASSGVGAVIPLATVVPGVASLAALPDETVIGMAGRPDLRLGLRPQDHLPIGDVTMPGKSASVLNSFELEETLRRFFGPARMADMRDRIYAAFVGDVKEAGFDVVPAPTINNPSHVRIVPQPGVSFDDPTFLERLLSKFTVVSELNPAN
jgi:hypothetical protein